MTIYRMNESHHSLSHRLSIQNIPKIKEKKNILIVTKKKRGIETLWKFKYFRKLITEILDEHKLTLEPRRNQKVTIIFNELE